jgi:hypothetical protein
MKKVFFNGYTGVGINSMYTSSSGDEWWNDEEPRFPGGKWQYANE